MVVQKNMVVNSHARWWQSHISKTFFTHFFPHHDYAKEFHSLFNLPSYSVYFWMRNRHRQITSFPRHVYHTTRKQARRSFGTQKMFYNINYLFNRAINISSSSKNSIKKFSIFSMPCPPMVTPIRLYKRQFLKSCLYQSLQKENEPILNTKNKSQPLITLPYIHARHVESLLQCSNNITSQRDTNP